MAEISGDNDSMIDTKTEKKALRTKVLAARDAMSVEERARAAAVVCDAVCASQAYAQANVILAYASFGTELQTQTLLERILVDKKILILPRVDKAVGCLQLHHMARLDELVVGVWGIREPPVDALIVPVADIELIVVPGVAFDRAGFRIGYGGGYYDKLLPTANPATARLSGTFDCQIVDAVPNEIHDQRVDVIFTPTQKIFIAHDRKTD